MWARLRLWVRWLNFDTASAFVTIISMYMEEINLRDYELLNRIGMA